MRATLTNPTSSMLSIKLESRHVAYLLKRSRKRRTIGLKIDDSGMTVSAPVRVSLNEIEKVLHTKSGWVLSKLNDWQNRPRFQQVWCHHAALPFKGTMIRLSVTQSVRVKRVRFDGQDLHLGVPDPHDESQIRASVERWLRVQARCMFRERLNFYSPELNVAPPPLRLSSAKNRWGSCNSRGEIRLNWHLIQMPAHLIDYVVAHELSHILEMNHSPKFWQTVAKLFPDYLNARTEIRELSHILIGV